MLILLILTHKRFQEVTLQTVLSLSLAPNPRGPPATPPMGPGHTDTIGLVEALATTICSRLVFILWDASVDSSLIFIGRKIIF